MKPTHELHVDLVRLLGATERLVADGEASAGGSWEHWPRFCQVCFLESIRPQTDTLYKYHIGLSAYFCGEAEQRAGCFDHCERATNSS